MFVPKIKDSACDKILEYFGVKAGDKVIIIADDGLRNKQSQREARYFIRNFGSDILCSFKKAAEKKNATVGPVFFDYNSGFVFEAESVLSYISKFDPIFIFLLCSNSVYIDLDQVVKKGMRRIIGQKLTPSIINWFAGLDYGKINSLTQSVKSLLEDSKGSICTLKTGATKSGCNFEFTAELPKTLGISSDSFESMHSNIPIGEVFFQPERGTSQGTLMLPAGAVAYQFPTTRPIKFIIQDGLLKKVSTKDDLLKKKFETFIQKKAEVCEIGIGTNPYVSQVPMNEQQHNGGGLAEKKLGTFHVAFGDSIFFGEGYGDMKNDFHADVIFPFGELKIGNTILVKNNKLLI